MAEAEQQNLFGDLKDFKVAKILHGTNADLEDAKNLDIVQIPVHESQNKSDVLVKVEAFALNPVDYKMNTLFPEHPTEHIIASDACGIVQAVGEDAKEFAKGDKVFLNTNLKAGVGAEYISVDKSLLAKADPDADSGAMAGLPLVATTAYDAIQALGELSEGQKVMVNGATGGVGSIVTQMCSKVYGCHVIAICSGKNEEYAKKLGASEVINYKEMNFADYGDKIRGFVDCVGGKSVWESAQNLLQEDGMFSTIVGDDPTFANNASTFARNANEEVKNYNFVFYSSDGEKLAQIAKMVADGKVEPQVCATYPASEIRAAMKHLKTGRPTGKIIVKWEEE